jgi:hypothetical protein
MNILMYCVQSYDAQQQKEYQPKVSISLYFHPAQVNACRHHLTYDLSVNCDAKAIASPARLLLSDQVQRQHGLAPGSKRHHVVLGKSRLQYFEG